ncbi:MAG: T9SS type A sorting domain-containing protein [Ignavibacteriaceae bacterium]
MENLSKIKLFLYSVLSILFFATNVFAQVTVQLPNIVRQTGSPDEFVNVTVDKIALTDSVRSANFRIYYDKNVITLDTVISDGSTLSNMSSMFLSDNPDSAKGVLRIAMAGFNPIYGSGILFKIKIHYKTNGTSALSFTDPATMSDSNSYFNSGKPAAKFVDGSVTISAVVPSLNLNSPNGGETWVGGTTENITWSSSNTNLVKLEYSLDKGVSWILIADSLSATPSFYSWTVPDTASTQALIRISDLNSPGIADTSNGVFTVLKKTKITVTSPNGGENWGAKSTHDITWTSINISNVKLEYSLDNGTNWSNIISSTPASPGKYTWTVPDTSSSSTKIRITNVSMPAVSDISDSVFTISPVTGIIDENTSYTYQLSQNYPNPFNPSTNISFSIPKESKVVLKVYNMLGQKVATLVNQTMAGGNYRYEFNADNLSSGIYIYRLQAGDFMFTKKMTLLK